MTLKDLAPDAGDVGDPRGSLTGEQLGFYPKTPEKKSQIFFKFWDDRNFISPKVWTFPVWRAAALAAPRRRTSGRVLGLLPFRSWCATAANNSTEEDEMGETRIKFHEDVMALPPVKRESRIEFFDQCVEMIRSTGQRPIVKTYWQYEVMLRAELAALEEEWAIIHFPLEEMS
jgi:hypothetical protein